MKKIIIIVFILFTVHGQSNAQYDEQPIADDSNTLSPFTNDGMKFSTVIPDLFTSYTRSDYFDMTTFFDEKKTITFEEQWFNVNQSQRRDSSRSFLFWKHQGLFECIFVLLFEILFDRFFTKKRCKLYSDI